MASAVKRIKWLLMGNFSRQKAEILALVFIFGLFCLIGSFVWQASVPPDGSYIDLSEQRQLELIEDFKNENVKQQELIEQHIRLNGRILDDEERLLKGQVAIPRDLRKGKSEEFNLTRHMQENKLFGGSGPQKKPSRPKNVVTLKPKTKEKFVEFYDPSIGKMIMKPVIVEDTELEGGKGHCSVYDLTQNVTENYECTTLSIRPTTSICLHPENLDIHISHHIKEEGIWEPHIVKDFQNILYGDPDLAVIDIGANIGVYTLLAAKMGHKVIAVEPFLKNIKRLQKAAQMDNTIDKITLVQNAVSDKRSKVFLKLQPVNQGGLSIQLENPDPDCLEASCRPPEVYSVHLDDLLEVITFNKAVLKIDIEGHEHRAFLHSSKLLDKVYVPFIFMEWLKLRQYHGSEITQSEDKDLTFKLIKFLVDRGYQAYSTVTHEKQNPDFWFGWTDDIVWKHNLREYN